MINEVDFSGQLVTGTLSVCTPTKTMTITTLRPAKLRAMATMIQSKVMEIRQEYGLHQTAATRQPERGFYRPEDNPVQSQPVYQVPQVPEPVATPQPAVEPNLAGLVEVTELPVPHRRNPYMGAPLMTRRRVGRFGPISVNPKDAPVTTAQPELLWARR